MGRTSSYHHAKYGGARGSRASSRPKSVMFFVFVFNLFVTLLNDKVCDNGNAMKQCNIQYSYGVSA